MLVRFVLGSLAGLIATGPMTAVMHLLFRLLPPQQQYPLPPRQIEERMTQEAGVGHQMEEDEHKMLTTLSHFGYGAATGGLYGLIAPALGVPTVLSGIGFGLLVWLVSYLGWLPALRILPSAKDQPEERNALMITAHLVWGAVVGILALWFAPSETHDT